MLVITGTQRSGTSLIAKALIESGYYLGADWWDEEAQGGLEHPVICAFYRDYLGDPSFPFDDMELPSYPEGYVEELFSSFFAFQVVKFSYLLMSPVFVRIWNKFRQHDTFLIMDRDKRDVVKSKFRLPQRFKHDSLLLNQPSNVLHYNYLASSLLLWGMEYKTQTLRFPACVNDLGKINYALARLDRSVQIDPAAWDRVLDKKKIHFGKGEYNAVS